ncbi:AMP-binding protein [Halopseudomonas pachastrellae]|nr:AMP-binding protein [Halopseudomonas pachastrellae]
MQQPTDLTLPDVVSETANIATANGVSRWQDALKANLRPGPLTAGPSDLCVIPYSSGTTGNPKGCVHTHHSVMATTVYGAAWVKPSTAASIWYRCRCSM